MQARDYRLDKAKGLLIFLVVLGHFLERMSGWGMDLSRGFLTAIYSFHMPAFILLAGITAKSNKLLDRILVFVVLVVTAQPIYRNWVAFLDSQPEIDLNEPYWITWFLLAMVWWFLLLPLVERFPVPMLVISVAVGVFGGIMSEYDYELSIGRAMTFFPFFVIGKLYGMRLLRWAGSLTIPLKLGLTIVAIVPVVYFYVLEFDHRWFYGAKGFEVLGATLSYGVVLRVCLLLSALLTTIVVLSWSDHIPDFMIVAGQRSLAIYLLHGLIVRGLDEPLHTLLGDTSELIAIVVCFVGAVLLTWILSWSWFERAIRWYSTTLAGWIAKLIRLPFPDRGKSSS